MSEVVAGDFAGGPVVKNLPCNAGGTSLSSGWGTKIQHAVEQLSPCASTSEAPVLWIQYTTFQSSMTRESVLHNKRSN